MNGTAPRSGFCYGYARVSTTMQGDKNSIKAQIDQIEKYAKNNDLTIVRIVTDTGVSGTKMKNRKKFLEILDELDAGDALVSYEYSRISRGTYDTSWLLEVLKAKRAYLICVQENIDTRGMSGALVASMFGMLGSIQAQQIQERVSVGIEFMKMRKQANGRPPYGWKLKDRGVKGAGLVEVPVEQEIIAIMRDEHRDGKSYQQIADLLNDNDIPTPGRSEVWSQHTVKGVVERTDVHVNGRA
jgi:site-specific DNA recombinase